MWQSELTTIDISELEEGGSRCFAYTDPFGQPAHGFVIRVDGELHAYRNLCPHWAVALDHQEEFFDEEGEELMCHMHGATFDPKTGECTFGPAEGSGLEKFTLEEVPGEPGKRKVLRRAGIAV